MVSLLLSYLTLLIFQKQQLLLNVSFLFLLAVFQPVSAMGILTLATLTWTHGWHQGTKAVESVIIVNTIQKASTASTASQATTETSGGLFLPQMPANVSQYLFLNMGYVPQDHIILTVICLPE